MVTSTPLHSLSLLQRPALPSLRGPAPSALQVQVDGLVGGFVHQATDWRSLAAMTVGGMAYRVGRIGVLSLGGGNVLRAASVGVGLTAEVSAFETTHRGLSSASAPENLWRWEGTGGLRQGLLQSFITFGTLKGAGRFARSENFILQHLVQDTAMVAGHQISGALEVAPRPTGSLAEQFLHAEATNLQIGAGMALAHRFSPGWHSLERGLDLSLQTSVGAAPRGRPQWTGAHIGAPLHGQRQSAFAIAGASPEMAARPRDPKIRGPHILAMGIFDWGGRKIREWWEGREPKEAAPEGSPENPFENLSDDPLPSLPAGGSPYRGVIRRGPLHPYLEFWRSQGAYDWQLTAFEDIFGQGIKRRKSRLPVIRMVSSPEGRKLIRAAAAETGIQEPRVRALLETALVHRLVTDYFEPSEFLVEFHRLRESILTDSPFPSFTLPAQKIAQAYLEIGRFSLWLPLGDSLVRQAAELYQGILIYDALVKKNSPEYYERLCRNLDEGKATFGGGYPTPLGLFSIWFDSSNAAPTPIPKWHFLSDIAQSVRFLLGSESLEERRRVLESYVALVEDLSEIPPRDRPKLIDALNPVLTRHDPELKDLAEKILSRLQEGPP